MKTHKNTAFIWNAVQITWHWQLFAKVSTNRNKKHSLFCADVELVSGVFTFDSRVVDFAKNPDKFQLFQIQLLINDGYLHFLFLETTGVAGAVVRLVRLVSIFTFR